MRAFREEAVRNGWHEVDLPWRTPEEDKAWNRSMPSWMKKLSKEILDRIELLKDKNLLQHDRRHLAVEFSNDIVPVDSLARLKVECYVSDRALFDEQVFVNVGGLLVLSVPDPSHPGFADVVAWIPPEQLQTLAESPQMIWIHSLPSFSTESTITPEGDRPRDPRDGEAKLEGQGLNWSEGETVHNVQNLKYPYNLFGSYQQVVGVLSNGVEHWQDATINGDLLNVETGLLGLGKGDEGTAICEIIYDLAPGARLLFAPFASPNNTIGDLVNAIDNLANRGANIIVDDVSVDGEPLWQEDWIIAQTRMNAAHRDILYIGAAGNSKEQHYENVWSNGYGGCYYVTTPGCTHTFGRPHDFDSNPQTKDPLLRVYLPKGHHLITLQWSEHWPTAHIDLNLYLLKPNGCIYKMSTDVQDGNDLAKETLAFDVPETEEGSYDLLIEYNDPFPCAELLTNLLLDLRALGGSSTWTEHKVRQHSLNAKARLDTVFAVGATSWEDSNNPHWAEPYSGEGWVEMFWTHNYDYVYHFVQRRKPDATGADKVQISGVGEFGSGTCPAVLPGGCRFAGTSSGAAHVGAIAALLHEAWAQRIPEHKVAQTLEECLRRGGDYYRYGISPEVGAGFIDAVLAFKRCLPNPAAEVLNFRVVNDVAEWHVSTEFATAGYVLEGSQSANGPWTQLGSMEPAGSHDYAVDVSGGGFPLTRLVEVETTGNRVIHGIETSGPPATAQPPLPSCEMLVAKLDSLEQVWTQSNITIESNGTKYIIFTPGIFLQDVQNYVAHFWETRGGYVPIVINTDNYPDDPNGFRQALKADIQDYAANGAKYFHLIGDATDAAETTDPAVYPALWVRDWEAIRQNYVQTCPPQPGKDIIPTYVVGDTLPRGRNMAFAHPYWFSDQDYADVNGDQVPDVVVTRWPVADRNGLLALAAKMQIYNVSFTSQAPYAASFYVYDIDYTESSGDGTLAAAVADAAAAEIPSGVTIYRINRSQFHDTGTWRATALANWNSNLPDVVFGAGSGSNLYEPVKLGLPEFAPAAMTSFALPLFVGASCGAADFASAENPAPNLGTPLSERLLTAFDTGPRGAIAWVGPTAGTWQSGNEAIARYVAQTLFANLNRPMAESWLVAIRGAILENTGINAYIVDTARSYVFLGDPLSPLKHIRDATTNIAEPFGQRPYLGLIQNTPNPFNPSTRIPFSTTRSGHVSLKIYDIQGRLVRTLLDTTLPGGLHQVDWRGDDDQGRRLVSGVYVCRLKAENSLFTRKLTLLK
jgi:hypothetical protein